MRITLGVTGGIAAYKAADLTSTAVGAGHSVRVAMTPAATHFVTPLTFQALCGHPVMVDPFAMHDTPEGDSSIEHIQWAKWTQIAVVAPLTASTLGKLAHGIADNALTTLWLALPPTVPRLLCPAMNTQMWHNPLVQQNLERLLALPGWSMVPPISKRLACGDRGMGGLAHPAHILSAAEALLDGPRS